MMPAPISATPKQKVVIKDDAGKISQTQKKKIHAFHELCDYLDLPYRRDLEDKNALELWRAIKERIEEKTAEPSEEEVVFMDGVTVTLGGKQYQVKRLPATKDREWRKKVGAFIQGAINYIQQEREDLSGAPDGDMAKGVYYINAAMPYIVTDGMDGLVDLFWAYAVDLDRAKIEEQGEVYSDEMMDAALGVFEMMLPFFVNQFKRIMKIAKRTGALRQP